MQVRIKLSSCLVPVAPKCPSDVSPVEAPHRALLRRLLLEGTIKAPRRGAGRLSISACTSVRDAGQFPLIGDF
jgi:hypothetical protein